MTEAQAALQVAIERWAADEGLTDPGWFVGDWILIGTASNPEEPDRTMYWHGFSGGSQPSHISHGLMAVAKEAL